jgi:ethanolamine utilization protein EutQ
MPTLVPKATRITAAGNKPKLIDEYIGRVNSKTAGVSVAHMRSPQGWVEPGQTPEFDEFTVVLKGTLRVRHKQGEMDVAAGQAVITHRGEWIQYFDASRRRSRIYCGVLTGVFDGDGAPGYVGCFSTNFSRMAEPRRQLRASLSGGHISVCPQSFVAYGFAFSGQAVQGGVQRKSRRLGGINFSDETKPARPLSNAFVELRLLRLFQKVNKGCDPCRRP